MLSTQFLLTALVIWFGAAVSTMVGFGFAVVAVPLLLLLHPAKQAVVLVILVSTAGSVVQWLRVRRHAHYRLVARLCLGALAGIPAGTAVLLLIQEAPLKVLIGMATLAAVAVTLLAPGGTDGAPRTPSVAAGLGTGVAAGALAAGIGQPGIPVVVLLAWTRWPKEVVRATLFSLFVVVNAVTTASLTAVGGVNGAQVRTAALLVPFYVAGIYVGDLGFQRAGPRALRRMMLTLLTAAGVASIANGAAALLG